MALLWHKLKYLKYEWRLQVHFHLEIESDAYFHSPHTITYTAKPWKIYECFLFSLSIKRSSSPPWDEDAVKVFAFILYFRLEELRIENNLLANLPNNLKLLRNLKSLQAANNKICKLPDFMTAMRFNNGVVSWRQLKSVRLKGRYLKKFKTNFFLKNYFLVF